jgi:hypothetical protein
MSDKYCFTMQIDRQIIEAKTDSEVLAYFKNDGADALMQLYTMAKAALNPPVRAKCTAEVTYDTQTGEWSTSVTCKGG